MTKKRELMFSIVRGLLAILIALLVATLLIFISANGESVSEKLSSTGDALKQMLVGPLFRMGKNGTRNAIHDVPPRVRKYFPPCARLQRAFSSSSV